ncbi:MAG: hypothetical protein M3P84_12625 [Chloroflexota bacterium]|nr:hypothetical protein [Chloroflexota bacterium]
MGDYSCLTRTAATAAIVADGFKLGVVTGPVNGLVVIQSPVKDTIADYQTEIDLTLESQPTTTITCPAP